MNTIQIYRHNREPVFANSKSGLLEFLAHLGTEGDLEYYMTGHPPRSACNCSGLQGNQLTGIVKNYVGIRPTSGLTWILVLHLRVQGSVLC